MLLYMKGYALHAGKELLNDALLLHEAGFTPEQCVVNVMGVAVSNSYSSPNPEALASQEAASPALLLAKEVRRHFVASLLSNQMPSIPIDALRSLGVQPLHSSSSFV